MAGNNVGARRAPTTAREFAGTIQRLSLARSVEAVHAEAGMAAQRLAGADLDVLQALADSTALALEHVHAREELDRARIDALQRLARIAELRDYATQQHAQRVAILSTELARALGLEPEIVDQIGLAAPLHDLGKLAVPERLLQKPGRLTPDEFERVKRHAEAGAAMLADSTSDVLQLAADVARSHHEWWDGSGYPAGLAGPEIPLAGRIVALADVFDALVNERPYKPAWPLGRAVVEIRRLSGAQFDPEVVAAFGRLDLAGVVSAPLRGEATSRAVRRPRPASPTTPPCGPRGRGAP